jgi:hypothetical protein
VGLQRQRAHLQHLLLLQLVVLLVAAPKLGQSGLEMSQRQQQLPRKHARRKKALNQQHLRLPHAVYLAVFVLCRDLYALLVLQNMLHLPTPQTHAPGLL